MFLGEREVCCPLKFFPLFCEFLRKLCSYINKCVFGILLGELEKLRREWKVLETECHSLKKENVLLSSELQRQEKELHKYARTLFLVSYLFILNFNLNLIFIFKYIFGAKCLARLLLVFAKLTILNEYFSIFFSTTTIMPVLSFWCTHRIQIN